MAKNSSVKGIGSSRVRFIMLDAELTDGDLTQITQAIQNALRPMSGPVIAGRSAPPPQRLSSPPTEIDEALVDEADAPPIKDAEVATSNLSSRSKSIRKLRTPKVIEVDLASDPSFASFAEIKKPTSDMMRFLVVAAWFKQHRQIDAITVDHVYTCYRAVKWPSGIDDFSQPLRDLKRRQLLEKKARGNYAINHLGLAEVDKLEGKKS
jgi:hypothetical protein